MEKDYVIFAGAEIDYPFWASWKVASLSADAVREQRAGRTVPEKPSMDSTSDLNFFFSTFHLFFLLCERAAFEDLLLQAGAVT